MPFPDSRPAGKNRDGFPLNLSLHLFREVRPEFFRLLAGGLARLYVDALDALETEAARRSEGLEREEALALIEQVVERHPDLVPDPGDPIAAAKTIREKGLAVFDTLKRAGWLEEEENRSDYRHIVFFDASGTLLLHAIRKIALPEGAVFSDKLVHVCTTLANPDALADQPWAQVESCLAALEVGLNELRTMQKSIERHTRRQLAAATLKENLSVLFDQFAERIGRNCYAQLVHARLPAKLAEARRALDGLALADCLTAMQTEVMRREPSLSPENAMARVRLRLSDLGQLLDQVEPLADAIDRRTAEFTRRSHARSRYLQETTSENRATVQTFFEGLNRRFAGRRVAELDELADDIPALKLHEVRVFGGIESLYTPRLRRTAGEIEPLDDTDTRQQDRALAQLENTMRDSLTVGRANQFVAALPGETGEGVSSDRLLGEFVHNDEDMASLIACLLHARSADARYRVEVPRDQTDADRATFDTKLGYLVERFHLVKK